MARKKKNNGPSLHLLMDALIQGYERIDTAPTAAKASVMLAIAGLAELAGNPDAGACLAFAVELADAAEQEMIAGQPIN